MKAILAVGLILCPNLGRSGEDIDWSHLLSLHCQDQCVVDYEAMLSLVSIVLSP